MSSDFFFDEFLQIVLNIATFDAGAPSRIGSPLAITECEASLKLYWRRKHDSKRSAT
jgi:hypothetical protein